MTTLWTGRWKHWGAEDFFLEVSVYRKTIHDSLLETFFVPEEYGTQAERTKCLAAIYRKGIRVVKVQLVAV